MLNEIKNRRSIRKFEDKRIEEDKIKELLKAAMCAPSAHNLQPCRYAIIRNKVMFQEIMSFHPYVSMLKSADTCILVLGDQEITTNQGFLYCDCSASIMNILTEAEHLGLSSCWCGVAPNEERCKAFSELFKLDKKYLPFGLIALGYSNEKKIEKANFDDTKILNIFD